MIVFTMMLQKMARRDMPCVDAGGKVGRRIQSFHSCLPHLPETHFSLLQLSSLGGTEAVPGVYSNLAVLK